MNPLLYFLFTLAACSSIIYSGEKGYNMDPTASGLQIGDGFPSSVVWSDALQYDYSSKNTTALQPEVSVLLSAFSSSLASSRRPAPLSATHVRRCFSLFQSECPQCTYSLQDYVDFAHEVGVLTQDQHYQLKELYHKSYFCSWDVVSMEPNFPPANIMESETFALTTPQDLARRLLTGPVMVSMPFPQSHLNSAKCSSTSPSPCILPPGTLAASSISSAPAVALITGFNTTSSLQAPSPESSQNTTTTPPVLLTSPEGLIFQIANPSVGRSWGVGGVAYTTFPSSPDGWVGIQIIESKARMRQRGEESWLEALIGSKLTLLAIGVVFLIAIGATGRNIWLERKGLRTLGDFEERSPLTGVR